MAKNLQCFNKATLSHSNTLPKSGTTRYSILSVPNLYIPFFFSQKAQNLQKQEIHFIVGLNVLGMCKNQQEAEVSSK